jgi:hypothetical protein
MLLEIASGPVLAVLRVQVPDTVPASSVELHVPLACSVCVFRVPAPVMFPNSGSEVNVSVLVVPLPVTSPVIRMKPPLAVEWSPITRFWKMRKFQRPCWTRAAFRYVPQ